MKMNLEEIRVCHQKKHSLDYDKITPYLYIGNNMCCQRHFEKELLQKGIKADFSVESERIDKPSGVDYYFWLPVQDRQAPTQKQMIVGAKMLKILIDGKIKTYVHCRLGHGRSPTIAIAYLILEGMAADEAIGFLMKKRRCMHLHDSQIRALKRFEKKWRR